VAPDPLARDADIANHTANTPTGHKNPAALSPNTIELYEESLVIGDIAKLCIRGLVLLERPVRWRRDHELDRFIRDPGEISRVALHQRVSSPVEGGRPRHVSRALVRGEKCLHSLGLVVGDREVVEGAV